MKRKSIYELMKLHSQGTFHWNPILFFQKTISITDYIHFYYSDSLFSTLTTLFRKTTLKNAFHGDYSDYADLHAKQIHH